MNEFSEILVEMSLSRGLPLVLLYIGPETMLPLVSALAAIGGVLLMFWQRFMGIVRRLWRVVLRREKG
jgi:hypothetical protein